MLRPFALALLLAACPLGGARAAAAAGPSLRALTPNPVAVQRGKRKSGKGGASSSLQKLLLGARAPSAGARAGEDEQERRRFNLREELKKVKELQVTSKARASERSEEAVAMADEAQLRSWFMICDHDQNGWLSYGEAEFSLHFERARFQVFDADRDGRLVANEFYDFYTDTILSVGKFLTPVEKTPGGPPPHRTAEQLRQAYDVDIDGLLSEDELTRLLVDYQHKGFSAERIMKSIDADADRHLSVAELGGVHAVLFPVDVTEDALREREAKRPRTVEQLFGQKIPRGVEGAQLPTPPQIAGPVPHFYRLDLDGDGFIEAADLEALLRPLRSSVRPSALINTLDADGDARLSAPEFEAAIAGRAR